MAIITTRIQNPLGREIAADILREIYMEKPAYWPHGLTVDHHDQGLWLIREPETLKPIGFTGWQKRAHGGKTVGYYSIGILPAYRQRGYAKEAVSTLLDHIRPQVDEVRALIVPDNTASEQLAASLQIPVTRKAASWSSTVNRALPVLGGLLGFQFSNQFHGSERDMSTGALSNTYANDTTRRAIGDLANTILFAALGSSFRGDKRQLMKLRPSEVGKVMAAIGATNAALKTHSIADTVEHSVVPAMNQATGNFASAMARYTGETADQQHAFRERLNRFHETASKALPYAIPTLAALAVLTPAAMAYRGWQSGRQLKALQGEIPLDDPLLMAAETADRASDQVKETLTDPLDLREDEEAVKQANFWSTAGKVLGGVAGALGANAATHSLLDNQEPLRESIPGRLLPWVNGVIGGVVGSKVPRMLGGFRGGRAAERAAAKAFSESVAPITLGSLGTLGVGTLNSVDRIADGAMGIVDPAIKTVERISDPISMIDHYVKAMEDKPWLKYLSLATIPLGALSVGAAVYHQGQQEKALNRIGQEILAAKRRELERTGQSRAKSVVDPEDEVYLSEAPPSNMIPFPKQASMHKRALNWKVLAPLLGGSANAALWDQYIYGDRKLTDLDAGRVLGAIVAATTGAFSGHNVRQGQYLDAGKYMLATPIERYAITGAASNEAARNLAQIQADKLVNPPSPSELPATIGQLAKDNPFATAALLTGLIGGAGYLGHRAVKALEKPQETVTTINQAPQGGRVKVTLPTRDPGDSETTVELPLPPEYGSLDISRSLFDTLGRDTRRRLRAESRERVRRKTLPSQDSPPSTELLFPKTAAVRRLAALLAAAA